MATPTKILLAYTRPADFASPGNKPATLPENNNFRAPEEVTTYFIPDSDPSQTANNQVIITEATAAAPQVLTFPQKLMQAQEQERQSLALELHDNVGQSLILVKNQILKMKKNLPETTETLGQLNTLAEMVTETLQKIRNISYGLRPYELNLFGLTHAIGSLAGEVAEVASWQLTLELTAIDNLFTKEFERYIYRIFEECLGIVEKRAGATAVQLRVYSNQQVITGEIHVTGPTTFGAFLAHYFNTDFNLLRLQELLKIVAGSIIFTEHATRITIMQIEIPIPLSLTYEKD